MSYLFLNSSVVYSFYLSTCLRALLDGGASCLADVIHLNVLRVA